MPDTFNTADKWNLAGQFADLLKKHTHNWLIGIRESDPAILDVFHDRDKIPCRDLLAWSGEFAGKYLAGTYYIYRLTGDRELYDYVQNFIAEFISCMDGETGYWGCYSQENRLKGYNHNQIEGTYEYEHTWDAWGHYHAMTGVYLWYLQTKNPQYLAAAEKAAACLMRTFYTGERRLLDMGSLEVNLSPLHIFALLYAETGKAEYLRFCEEVLKDVEAPGSGEFMRIAAEGKDYYQSPQPRWESLHTLLGMLAYGKAARRPEYVQAVQNLFYSILKTDIHNTGAFSTDEKACGSPFRPGTIELCCVVACNALACEILKQTADSKVADFLEISFYNAVLGSFSPTGKWSTYNTPMEGVKRANYDQIQFQSRAGAPDLNCCSANSARALGTFAEWAVLEDENAVYINSYENMSPTSESGARIEIRGAYPADGSVTISAKNLKNRKLALRIPCWSENTVIRIKDAEYKPQAGSYFYLSDAEGETISLLLDFSPHYLEGQESVQGRTSLYYGPILYAYDAALCGKYQLGSLPPLRRADAEKARPALRQDGRLTVCIGGLTLCDFYRAGSSGSAYTTWLNLV